MLGTVHRRYHRSHRSSSIKATTKSPLQSSPIIMPGGRSQSRSNTRSRSRQRAGGNSETTGRGRGRGSGRGRGRGRGHGRGCGHGRGRGRGRSSPDEGGHTRQKRRKVTRNEPSAPAQPPPSPTEYAKIIDPKDITGPVPELVHDALRGTWRINKKNDMALIFDIINPVTHFKRGEVYDNDEHDAFADYDPDHENDPDITEDDAEGKAKPYNAIPCW